MGNNHPLVAVLRPRPEPATEQPPVKAILSRECVMLAALTLPFAGCVTVLAVYVVPQIASIVAELKDISQDTRDARDRVAARQAEGSARIEAAGKEVTRQQAQIIANHELVKQLTSENLRLAAELNKELTARRRE